MRRVIGPAIGALISTPKGSRVAYAAGEIGVLTVHESGREHPGKAFATPCYAAGIDPRSLDSSEFETVSFIRTGCGDLEWRSDDEFAIYRHGGEGYLFRLLVGPGTAEPTSNDES